ncbi:hypothetical protein NB311A_13181 [Nitrobacter sp. Nb-311A]|nr:hypothetical protein NB311A_13181 [Nitrobacter sp. Nb-311A]
MPDSAERYDLLKEIRQAECAANIEAWSTLPGSSRRNSLPESDDRGNRNAGADFDCASFAARARRWEPSFRHAGGSSRLKNASSKRIVIRNNMMARWKTDASSKPQRKRDKRSVANSAQYGNRWDGPFAVVFILYFASGG